MVTINRKLFLMFNNEFLKVAMFSYNLGYKQSAFSVFTPIGVEVKKAMSENDIVILPEGVSMMPLDSIIEYSKGCNCVLINGSSFAPNQTNCCDIIHNGISHKIYKKNLTIEEKLMGVLVNDNESHNYKKLLKFGDLTISVYICKDFIDDIITDRSDVIVVIQDDDNIEMFNNRAIETVKGFKNFVIGCNTAGNESTIYGIGNKRISWFAENNKFKEVGASDNILLRRELKHKERFDFELNIGVPFSFPFAYGKLGIEPIIKYKTFFIDEETK